MSYSFSVSPFHYFEYSFRQCLTAFYAMHLLLMYCFIGKKRKKKSFSYVITYFSEKSFKFLSDLIGFYLFTLRGANIVRPMHVLVYAYTGFLNSLFFNFCFKTDTKIAKLTGIEIQLVAISLLINYEIVI